MMTTVEADYAADHWFLSAFKWSRNRKGNYCRRYEGKLLTVYGKCGWFYWCINAGRNAVTFSQRGYRTEAAAMHGLWKALHPGEMVQSPNIAPEKE